MNARAHFDSLLGLSSEQVHKALESLSRSELLDLAQAGAAKLAETFNEIPGLIYDGMEEQLPTHTASALEAQRVLARLQQR